MPCKSSHGSSFADPSNSWQHFLFGIPSTAGLAMLLGQRYLRRSAGRPGYLPAGDQQGVATRCRVRLRAAWVERSRHALLQPGL